MLKDLTNFARFRYGRGVMVPYWLGYYQVKEFFPRRSYLDHVMSTRWIREGLLGMEFLTHQGFILSHLWVPLWRVCYMLKFLSFTMQHFSKPFICIFIKSKHRVLCVIKIKRALQYDLKLYHIKFHMHWKTKDTAMHSPNKWDIIYSFF